MLRTVAIFLFLFALPIRGASMNIVRVRYIVTDVDQAVNFYTKVLDFTLEDRPAPPFAIVARGNLRLLLSAPVGRGGAAQTMPDGRKPEPGGWNRIQVEVDDLESLVTRLRKEGATFRNDVVTGFGGKQILIDDPSGNCVELFEPPKR
jgi:catechol 2,3-dioxygenase-like lactoylglutathione lyase family enzyme